jgi:hypothetical protein
MSAANESAMSARLGVFGVAGLVAMTMTMTMAMGCGGIGEDESDEPFREIDQELSAKAVCTKANLHTEDCQLLRFYLTVGAPEGGRRDAIARAFSWVEQGVMYSKTRNHSDANGSYRQDCSGFVSMAWGLPGSYSTRRFAPFSGEWTFDIGEYADLEPGDALNRSRPKNGNYHIVLFAGWADEARTEYFVLEESGTGSPAMLSKHYWTELGEFRPIRRIGY